MQNQVFVRFGRQLSTLSNPPVRRGVQLPNLDKRQFTPLVKERFPLPENVWEISSISRQTRL